MKTGQSFGLIFVLLVICQILFCNYFQFTPYATLTILPAIILCTPLTISTSGCMFLAFAAGFAVDWLSEGIMGLNAASLVPVAFLRKPFIRIFFGEDLIVRHDSFSFRKNGIMKVSAALTSSIAVFLVIYVFLDGAGTRPLWFNLARCGASLAISWLVSIIVVNILAPDDRKQ